jgi:hypothetical protein
MNQTIPTQATLAFTLANGLSIQLITLSVALIGLTVTFAKDFQHNNRVSTWLLIGIWVALFVSIYSGLNTIKALISIIDAIQAPDVPANAANAPPSVPPSPTVSFNSNSLGWAWWQENSFNLGVVAFIILGLSLILSKMLPKPTAVVTDAVVTDAPPHDDPPPDALPRP